MPLGIMVLAAFNANSTPSATDWQGFTLDWFTGRFDDGGNLEVRGLPQDARFLQGLWHSLLIALGAIAISIPLGLSGALLLTRLQSREHAALWPLISWRSAWLASLIETAKLNGVNPHAWLKATLEAIANGHPNSRLDDTSCPGTSPARQADKSGVALVPL